MATFISPDGNPEVWEEKPEGYFTQDEWIKLHPLPVYVPYFDKDGNRILLQESEQKPEGFYTQEEYNNLPDVLNKHKEQKLAEVDKKTQQTMVQNGMEFEGLKFPLTQEDLTNYNELYSIKDDLSYPINLFTMDEQVYELKNPDDIKKFYVSLVSLKNKVKSESLLIRQQIKSATTYQELLDIQV